MVSFAERSRLFTISYQIGDLADHLPNVGLILLPLHGLVQPDPHEIVKSRFVDHWLCSVAAICDSLEMAV
jgi:hypothetical protein